MYDLFYSKGGLKVGTQKVELVPLTRLELPTCRLLLAARLKRADARQISIHIHRLDGGLLPDLGPRWKQPLQRRSQAPIDIHTLGRLAHLEQRAEEKGKNNRKRTSARGREGVKQVKCPP